MRLPVLRIFSILSDAILPPRATDSRVRALTPLLLAAKARQDGTLPYHDEDITALVWEIKYRRNRHALSLAGAYLADLLLGAAGEEIGRPLFIPVPMHPRRRKERGYNQTELLCEAALTNIKEGVEYAPSLLRRIRYTTPQQKLSRTKRLHTLAGAMEANGAVKNRVCIVVDDVSTTGATLAEAKRALQQAGAREIICISLAQS